MVRLGGKPSQGLARGLRGVLTGSPPAPVRSHACENDQYGKPGGCSDICLLANSHKARTCRCRSGFSLGSDGKSCKSKCCGTAWVPVGMRHEGSASHSPALPSKMQRDGGT